MKTFNQMRLSVGLRQPEAIRRSSWSKEREIAIGRTTETGRQDNRVLQSWSCGDTGRHSIPMTYSGMTNQMASYVPAFRGAFPAEQENCDEDWKWKHCKYECVSALEAVTSSVISIWQSMGLLIPVVCVLIIHVPQQHPVYLPPAEGGGWRPKSSFKQ